MLEARERKGDRILNDRTGEHFGFKPLPEGRKKFGRGFKPTNKQMIIV